MGRGAEGGSTKGRKAARREDGALVAVVTGASRGAGRGIALELGAVGATVYVAGRSVRGGPPAVDGAPGTIDDTADDVTARGGRGIAVRTDCTDEGQVAALFARVAAEQDGRLDVLANAVWGANDAAASTAEVMAAWGKPFWELPAAGWRHHMDAGPRAYFLASREAARLMAPRKRGVIAGITDGIIDGVRDEVLDGTEAGAYSGALMWDLAHTTINRLMFGMAHDLKKAKVAVVTLMPGFMRTERVERAMTSEQVKRQFRHDLSETTAYVGRAVVALAGDRTAHAKSGRIHFVADLARDYGFTDAGGIAVPRFKPF
jgi:NAD(P)-dependent dehydrogenase (short-subunit alcohol dehydrogenase family)